MNLKGVIDPFFYAMNKAINIRVLIFVFSIASMAFLVTRIGFAWFEMIMALLILAFVLFLGFRSSGKQISLYWFLIVWSPLIISITSWSIYLFTPCEWQTHQINWDASSFDEQSGTIELIELSGTEDSGKVIGIFQPEDIGEQWKYIHLYKGHGPLDREVIRTITFNNDSIHP